MAVFVVQQPKNSPGKAVYDISPCLSFGEPEFIFNSWEQPGNTPVPAQRKVHAMLRRFRPEHDYILWAGGDPFALALVSAMLVERYSSYNFLRWERGLGSKQPGYYIAVQLKGTQWQKTLATL